MDGSSTIELGDPLLRELQSELAAPFPPERVHWRVMQVYENKEVALVAAYIDARDVYDRLDEVCGVAGWQCTHHDGGDGRLTASIGILVNGEWVWKSDGAGARQSSAGLSEQDANKGDYSDAIKRAAVAWGIGRYLYNLGRTYADVEQKGRTWVIKDDQQGKLRNALHDVAGSAIGLTTRGEQNLARVLVATLEQFCEGPQQVDEFIERNRGTLETLTKAQKGEVWAAMTRIREKAIQ